MLRKPFAVFFLVIFLANTAGLGLLSAYLLHRHRVEMKEAAKSQSGEILRIAIADLESGKEKLDWVKEHEFDFHGNRYDVISQSREGDFLVIRCINDTKEKKLERRLAEQTESNSDSPAKKNSSVKKGINDYLAESAPFFIPAPSVPVERAPFLSHIPGTFFTVDSPPPRSV